MTLRSSRTSGQALVETALVIPLVILIFLVIFECGLAYNTRQAVTRAAREGARSAVVLNPTVTQADVKATIRYSLGRSGVAGEPVTINFDEKVPPGGHWRETGALQTVYVEVQHRFEFLGSILKAVTGSETITISSLVTMRNE